MILTRREFTFALSTTALVAAAGLSPFRLIGSAAAQDANPAELAQPVPLGDVVLGAANSPVTIIEYASMSCGHCASTVESALRSRPGVRNAKVHLDSGAAEVEYDETSVAPEQLIASVQDVGYDATFAGR